MELYDRIMVEIQKAVIGKDAIIKKVLMVVLSRGHVLLEDIPGVGKTTLALAFSKALSLDYRRVQFTPDVLPADVVGFSVYNKGTGLLDYKPGPVLCNLFLADEINRTSSKTQSALLEVMEEGRVTVDGVTRETPQPFTVLATQNPIGSAGTQLLPESQLDRFMVCLSMGYPEPGEEIEILKRKHGGDPLLGIRPVAGAQDLIRMQKQTDEVYLSDEIYDYIVRLTVATREHAALRLGAGPRASIALAKMAQASAYLGGRDYVLPEDVMDVFPAVVCHRIVLGAQAKLENKKAEQIVSMICKDVKAPSIRRERA